MLIPVSSNVVQALYIVVFDVSMPVVLAWVTAILLSSVNLKIIHDDRKVLCLRQIPFPLLFNQGVTSRVVGLSVAASSTLIFLFAIAGHFAINGVTKTVIRERQVPYLVDRALPGEVLDLSKHVSEGGLDKTGTYHAIFYSQLCLSVRKDGISIYSAFLDIPDIPESEWTEELVQEKVVCRVKSSGYNETVALFEETKEDIQLGGRCIFNVTNESWDGVAEVKTQFPQGCPLRIVRTWCAKLSRHFCVATLEADQGFTFLAQEFSEQGVGNSSLFQSGQGMIYPFFVKDKPSEESTRSMAYILSADPRLHPTTASHMSMLSIERNGRIEEVVEVEKTEINTKLLAAVISFALFVVIGTGVAALVLRFLYRISKERGNYNSFLSATDMLSCAIHEVKGTRNNAFKSSGTYAVKAVDGTAFLYEATSDDSFSDELPKWRGL